MGISTDVLREEQLRNVMLWLVHVFGRVLIISFEMLGELDLL